MFVEKYLPYIKNREINQNFEDNRIIFACH